MPFSIVSERSGAESRCEGATLGFPGSLLALRTDQPLRLCIHKNTGIQYLRIPLYKDFPAPSDAAG